ncbi:pentatricopeptide repeat-containing protein [Salix suchowensis]|nr:pentatricopeptide repeat-containing protein [Salix suchowensis]
MSTVTTLPTIPVPLNSTALYAALSSTPTSLPHLKQFHAHVLRSDLPPSLILKLLLSSPSFSSSSLDYALSVFTHLPTCHTPLSNKLLRSLSRSAKPENALLAYEKMRLKEGLLGIDRFSFPPLLKAASRASGLNEGKEIHGVAAKLGFDKDPFVQTGLVGMYASCDRISDARLVFDKMPYRDVVAWSIMIDGYHQNGLYDDVLQLFEEMRSSNLKPDEMILATILSACGRARNLSYGEAIHDFIIENNVVLDTYLQSALLTMYASCGCMEMAQKLFSRISSRNLVVLTAMISGYSRVGRVEDARLIFDQMEEKDLVCWSAMISGYAESDKPQEALNLFIEMQVFGIKPDQVTILSVISACAHLGVLDRAQWIHMFVDKNGLGGTLPVNNALIDLYAKCGNLGAARRVFEKMQSRNVISWTSMINAFAIHGDANENIKPNGVTFVGVLYACSHAGLVEEGRRTFASMINEHNITPKLEHYGCMVDLFGRANLLRDALELVETMPLAPNTVIWGSLMAACHIHGENELGEFAAKQVLELEPDHDGALVQLSNIYAKDRRWQDVGEIRNLMKQRGISKERGCSWIELNNKVYEFVMADKKHKQADKIYEKLDEVVKELKLVGYTPNTSRVLVDVEEEGKKEVVLWHSEKLALCFGLMGEGKGSCIRIVKNLRVCEDCHTFIKLVSKVYGMEIIVRDRTRFHHYKAGVCSCNDYW